MTALSIQGDGSPLSIAELEKVPMRPQEFRLIGRFISFTFNDLKWVGLVTIFTKDTMVTANTLRMSKEYFEGPFRTGIRPDGKPEQQASGTPSSSASSSHPAPPSSSHGNGATTVVAVPPPAVSPSADPFVHPPAQPVVPAPVVVWEPPKLLAFATFNRKDVQSVQYAADHGRAHRSLTPSGPRNMPSEQLIRSYIRRYLVHTASQNNPHNILLLDFVRTRVKSEAPQAAEVQAMAMEELTALGKVEEELVARRDRAAAARQLNAAAAAAGGGGGGAANIRDGGRELLYSVNVPARTSYVAIAHLAFAITGLLYAASAYSSADRNIVYGFFGGTTTWVICSSGSLLLAGGATGFHGLNMTYPVTKPIPFFLRLLFLVVAFGMVISAAVGLSLLNFHDTDPMTVPQGQKGLRLLARWE